MAWGTLMIIADEENEPRSQDNYLTALLHYIKFSNWNPAACMILAPDDWPFEDINRVGLPEKSVIIDKIENNLHGLDKIIYIDDHSNVIDGGWKFKDSSLNEDKITYAEIKASLLKDPGTTNILICRGNESGEAAQSTNLQSVFNKIFCSMADNENHGSDIDRYLISAANSPEEFEDVHDYQTTYLKGTTPPQNPKKWHP